MADATERLIAESQRACEQLAEALSNYISAIAVVNGQHAYACADEMKRKLGAHIAEAVSASPSLVRAPAPWYRRHAGRGWNR